MKVTVINPNSLRAVTRTITTVARAAAEPGIDLIIAENRRAPLSIEGFTDGIEAVMNAAVMISSRFSIVTAMQRSVPILEDNARRLWSAQQMSRDTRIRSTCVEFRRSRHRRLLQ